MFCIEHIHSPPLDPSAVIVIDAIFWVSLIIFVVGLVLMVIKGK